MLEGEAFFLQELTPAEKGVGEKVEVIRHSPSYCLPEVSSSG